MGREAVKTYYCQFHDGELVFCMRKDDYEYIKQLTRMFPELQPLYQAEEVKCNVEYSARGLVKWAQCTRPNGEKIADRREYIEKITYLAEMYKKVLEEARKKLPEHPRIETSRHRDGAGIYLGSTRVISARLARRYMVVYFPSIPELEEAIIPILERHGFVQGNYGGYIKRGKREELEKELDPLIEELADKLKELIEKHGRELIEKIFRREIDEIKTARSLLLWSDEWNPYKPLIEDLKEKLGYTAVHHEAPAAPAETGEEAYTAIKRIIIHTPAQLDIITSIISKHLDKVKKKNGTLIAPRSLAEELKKIGIKIEEEPAEKIAA